MPDMMNTVPMAAKTILTALMRAVSERVMTVTTRQTVPCSAIRVGIESGQDRQKGTLSGLGRLAWQELGLARKRTETPTEPGLTLW
jgi:hypothetical protein